MITWRSISFIIVQRSSIKNKILLFRVIHKLVGIFHYKFYFNDVRIRKNDDFVPIWFSDDKKKLKQLESNEYKHM